MDILGQVERAVKESEKEGYEVFWGDGSVPGPADQTWTGRGEEWMELRSSMFPVGKLLPGRLYRRRKERPRRLCLKAREVWEDQWMVKVAEQSHRGTEFTSNGRIYWESHRENVRICSDGWPELVPGRPVRLYVRGDCGSAYDDKAFAINTAECMERIMRAVREYNNGGYDLYYQPELPGMEDRIIE